MMELRLTIKQLVIPGLRVSGFKDYFMVIIPRAYNNYIISVCNAYLVINNEIFPLGTKKVTKITNKNYAIFLPKPLNDRWKKLYDEKTKVDLVLEFF
ncbi:hypothetical protein V6M85_13795 [Sulfolobus tengchongensis]|uniref:Uncharacterized protein n=1 Tax=Sulfolobus tengchongensis TaxID=207809 RepID=A0AAX4L2R4_9CREN